MPARGPDEGDTLSVQSDQYAALFDRLRELRQELASREEEREELLESLPDGARESARNLLHYLTLRSHDLRDLQERLTRHGLSSLGGAEPHVLWTLESVLGVLRRLHSEQAGREPRDAVSPERAGELVDARTEALFGAPPEDRAVRIMVTMPSHAAEDYGLIRNLLAAGMDCMRINCAHDAPEDWEAMIAHLRRAEREVGRACRVQMDLPGPRVRTGPLPPGPEVVKVSPRLDAVGRARRPARVWLTPTDAPEAAPKKPRATLPLPADFLRALEVGDRLTFTDARRAERHLDVIQRVGASAWAELRRPAFILGGTLLTRERRGGHEADGPRSAPVGPLPRQQRFLLLHPGDRLVLTRDPGDARTARTRPDTGEREPARIACLPVEALDAVGVGERIWFDDGKIGGVIREVGSEVGVDITGGRAKGEKLKAEKGINLPDTALPLPPLTAEDLALLPFIARHADLVGYSFVRSAADVRHLREELARVGAEGLGIILKIETVKAFEQLPAMLLEGLCGGPLGVMIARGDLAVEGGFARMAEVQEEILWLTEAAHIPSIWATQVMEALAKKGRPSRAEITDAAMGQRAECVMLNKGPHIVDAVRALVSIFARMGGHQHKKRSRLRRLEVAAGFTGGAGEAREGDVGQRQDGS
ncbi:MAG TPA: pyruvate kinase [Longimicrobiales bacterium]|nr:pyruvate kinase [Longimicrobiales bacterium]